jgi:hypothetical protein
MATTIKWAAASARATGIADDTLTAGANLVSDPIANATACDRFLAVWLTFTCAEVPAGTIEVYLLPSQNGTAYPDGAADMDPSGTPIAIFSAAAKTTAQNPLPEINIPIPPKDFKLLLKSELDKGATCTLSAETYNETMA